MGTPHKKPQRLTPPRRKRTLSGRKLFSVSFFSQLYGEILRESLFCLSVPDFLLNYKTIVKDLRNHPAMVSGVPMPTIYPLPVESSITAFVPS